jgi:hypothetical protein
MKTKTPTFILELPLRTTPVQESTILVRLDAGRQLYNACLGEALTRLDLLRQSKEFQEIRQLPKGDYRTEAFHNLDEKFGFTEYDLHHYAVGIRHSWIEEHIGVHIAEKIAARAFNAVQKKAFGKAKNVRFKGKNQFDYILLSRALSKKKPKAMPEIERRGLADYAKAYKGDRFPGVGPKGTEASDHCAVFIEINI